MKSYLKKVSDSLVLYKSSGQYKYIREVEEQLKEYCLADSIIFYAYVKNDDTLSLFSEKKKKAFKLKNSLIKQCIKTKSSMIVDHVHSNKFYTTSIDNPLDIKIKSMMIIPLIKDDEVLGVVILYKDIKRRTVFLNVDEIIFENFSFLLLDMFSEIKAKNSDNNKNNPTTIPMERRSKDRRANQVKEETVKLELEIQTLKGNFLNIEKENKLLKKEVSSLKAIENKNTENANNQKDEIKELNTLKGNFLNIEKENELLKKEVSLLKAIENKNTENTNNQKDEIKELKTIIQKRLKEYNKKIEEKDKRIEKYEKNIEELNAKGSVKTLDTTNNTYLNENKKLEQEVTYLNQEIEYLSSEMKKVDKENELLLKTNQKSTSIGKKKKEHKEIWLQKKDEKENLNIEFILKDVDSMFGKNEQAYILFELMVFSLTSNDNMRVIEEKIQNSKMILPIVEDFKFGNILKIRNDKYLVSEFIDNIKNFENIVLHPTIKLKISLDKYMPTYFICDGVKLQSIVRHLLVDLQNFVDHRKPIELNFTHNTKLLHIEIGGNLFEEEGGFLSGFTKKNIVKDISKRPALLVSREILNSFEHDITPMYTDKYYKFMLDVPIEVFKEPLTNSNPTSS